jgi:hypothetical protein
MGWRRLPQDTTNASNNDDVRNVRARSACYYESDGFWIWKTGQHHRSPHKAGALVVRDRGMMTWFSNWQSRRRLLGLVHKATQLIYSDFSDFAEIVSHLERVGPRATVEEIYVAIKAVYEIEGAFEDAVYSVRQISDRSAIGKFIDEGLAELKAAGDETEVEVRRLNKELIKAKAEHAFSSIRMAFALADLVPEESFGGLVRKGNRINRGPISIVQRKRFKVLADDLNGAQTTLRSLAEDEKRLLAEQERLQVELDSYQNDEFEDDDNPRDAYPHAFNFHYSIEDDDEPFSVADHHIIENAVNRWSDKTNYFCEIVRNDRGFVISVWCFSDSRENIGTNLFLDLAENAFRTIGKSIRYI